MTIPSITPLPEAPDPGSPSTFDTLATAFMSQLPDFGTELNASITAMNTAVTDINADVAAADADATTATTKAAEAAASALAAVNAPGTNATSTTSLTIQTTLPTNISLTIQTGKSLVPGHFVNVAYTTAPENCMTGTVVTYNSGTGALVVRVTSSQGAGTYTAWTLSLNPLPLTTVSNSVVSKSAAFTAYKADKGRLYDCTGTWTLSLDAAATLEDGWYIYIKNGSGTITVDPNASELIDGASTTTVLPDSTALIVCNGSALTKVSLSSPNGMRLLATMTPTAAAALDFLTTFNSLYDNYLIIGEGITCATSASYLRMRLANAGVVDAGGGGSNYFQSTDETQDTTGATWFDINTTASMINSTGSMNFQIAVQNVNDATLIKSIDSSAVFRTNNTPAYSAARKTGSYVAASAVSGFRLYLDTGNNFGATGKVRVYGYMNS